MKVKARVLSEKGILASDPALGKMNHTRWQFEAWQLRMKDETFVKIASQIGELALKGIRDVLVTVLGLNFEPITVPNPAKPEEPTYRWPEPGEFTPLSFIVASPMYMAQAAKKIEAITGGSEDSKAIDTPDVLTEEDLQFFDDIAPTGDAMKNAIWNNPETQKQVRARVQVMDSRGPPVPPSAPPRPPAAKRPRLKIEQK